MCIAQTAKRRRRHFAIGFRHLAKLGRPIYSHTGGTSVAEAIERERAAARRQYEIAARKNKRKR